MMVLPGRLLHQDQVSKHCRLRENRRSAYQGERKSILAYPYRNIQLQDNHFLQDVTLRKDAEDSAVGIQASLGDRQVRRAGLHGH